MDRQISIASKTLHLESHQLDCEFQKVIDHAVDNINLQSLSEEIKLLLKFYITSCSLKNGATIGSKIYKLQLVNGGSSELPGKLTSNNIILFNTFNIVLPYLLRRKETLRTLLRKIPGNHEAHWPDSDYFVLLSKAMSVMNFFVFLFEGKYLTIAERISRIVPLISDIDYCASTAINRVQIELHNREIIWRELASFITTVIPYMRAEKIRSKLMQILYTFVPEVRQNQSNIGQSANVRMDLHRCGICESQPFNPYSIGCRHIFCYYCLESRHQLDPSTGYSCKKCNYNTKNASEVRRHKVYATLDA